MTFQGRLQVTMLNSFIRGLTYDEARAKAAKHFDEIFARTGQVHDDDLGLAYAFELHEETPDAQRLREEAKQQLRADDDIAVDDDAGVSLLDNPKAINPEARIAGHVQVWHYVEVLDAK